MSMLTLFFTFAKFGLLCFGGGYMLIPLLTAEFVGAPPAPLSPAEFSNLVSIAQVTPGPIGINTATYVGFTQRGVTGGVVATGGMVCVSLILVIIAIRLLKKYHDSVWVRGFLAGMRPASFGLILSAGIIFAELSVFDRSLDWLHPVNLLKVHVSPAALLIALITIPLLWKKKAPMTVLLIASAAVGAFFC